jgi:hypothetical protein
MLEELKIKIWGHQPVPNISSRTIEKIIQRDYRNCITEVTGKLKIIRSDSLKGQNRISAAVLKLADGKIDKIDTFIEMCKTDFRDVLANAEYPLCSSYGFGEKTKKELRTIYLTDWKNYSKWLTGN